VFKGKLRVKTKSDEVERGGRRSHEPPEGEESAEICQFGGVEPRNHWCQSIEVDICQEEMEIVARIQVEENQQKIREEGGLW